MKFREEQPENPIYREDWQELLGAIDLPKSIIENGEF
ncbi:DUF928 domain-containing protein [Limnospira fusiformis KN01]|nr:MULTISPECIES: DUF928 domain-containing protein [Limnospira]MDT9188935.1 DUF928 domain-containing protein [Limnospira sp. PMC 894.15]MDT9199241.1 DUF928 domain-containing protein [Limnospira sp. PMC 1042.18]MDY7054730.1 DUF928 domain-containing protein [Limnospira fusiformis LS22]ULB47912.1 DUF928 domain-containing protein [Limnospira fusiformis KN01]